MTKRLILGTLTDSLLPVYITVNKEGYFIVMKGVESRIDDSLASVLNRDYFMDDSLIKNWTDCALGALDEILVEANEVCVAIASCTDEWTQHPASYKQSGLLKEAIKAVQRRTWKNLEQMAASPERICNTCYKQRECSIQAQKEE